MKRASVLFFLFCTAVAGVVAAATLSPPVRFAVEKALAREYDAAARYDVFAAKAAEEGYAGAAALFRAQARAERTHAERFAGILRDNGIPVPPAPAPAALHAGSTAENLRTAANAEIAERDGTYREAIDTCIQNHADDIAKIFDQTRDSEVEHVNLCQTAARDVSAMKDAKTFYVCGKCGYTTDVKLPFCPACAAKHPLNPVE